MESRTLRYRIGILALIITAWLALVANAQEITGSFVGSVKDSTGAAIAGATVTITDAAKKAVVRLVTTNEEGEFSAPLLQPGVYEISVESPNFKKQVQRNIKLDLNQRRSVDLILEVGNISEVVTVEASALAVETTTPTASSLIGGDQARELSLNNRNWVQLVALAPGVSNDLADQVYVGTTNPDGQANTIGIAVNGARQSQNTFTVDGADITDRGSNITIQAYPNIDSIGEFKVLRSLYPAESGAAAAVRSTSLPDRADRDFMAAPSSFCETKCSMPITSLTILLPHPNSDVTVTAKPNARHSATTTSGGHWAAQSICRRNISDPLDLRNRKRDSSSSSPRNSGVTVDTGPPEPQPCLIANCATGFSRLRFVSIARRSGKIAVRDNSSFRRILLFRQICIARRPWGI
ncbi:MAG: carboxypeptidase regulatory-like domain-containing protein [Acidobacteria bacterium]|nr:carboxypeptidase regulatory-like domain-containing protein [Acidobacteriota bacterium]